MNYDNMLILAGAILVMIIFTIWYSKHSYLYADVLYEGEKWETVGPFKSESDFQAWYSAHVDSMLGFNLKYKFHLKSPYDTKSGS